MKGAVGLDNDPDDENNIVSINTDGIIQSLSQLSRLNIPTADKAVQRILKCFNFVVNSDSTVTRKRHSDQQQDKGNATATANKGKGTADEGRRAEERNKTCEDIWQCKDCDRVFSSKSYLDRHMNNEHSAKRRRLVQHDVFECDDCDSAFATEAALKEHELTHAGSNAPKTTKYKCDLCDKERSGIYNHYKSMHKIEYPEQILFYNGNALVRSAMDSKGGKATWFINEKENVTKRYKDVTCRLCESEINFNNAEMLAVHYTLIHMVNPDLLNNLNFLFRATKGSHLGLSASKPSVPIREHVPRMKKTENGAIRWPCNLCEGTFSTKGNLIKHVRNVHSKNTAKLAFACNYCDQVFDTQALLSKHTNSKHRVEDNNDNSSKKNKCTLCHKKIATIYKHYGQHNIEYPEQIMIANGNVLVRSNIDTKGGLAPWFIKEKSKMETLKATACRLCETEYDNSAMLEQHYRSYHFVVPAAMKDLQYMFRAAKGAHMADLPTSGAAKRKYLIKSCPNRNSCQSGDSKKEIKGKTSDEHKNKKLIVLVEKKDLNSMIMYQCEECEVATSTYDSSIEHAQLHHLEYYRPITETCHICNLAFEPQCYANHTSNYVHDTERKILKYNPRNLLNDDWSEIFQGLPESVAQQIMSSSVYQYTRAVKINSDEVSGIPLYQCGMCELFVRPKEIEEHCSNKNACVKNKTHDYYCPECDVFFYSSLAITEHYEEHENGREINSFRKTTFNCRQDNTINKALQVQRGLLERMVPRDENVPAPAEVIPEKTQRKSKPSIEVIESIQVSAFCDYCKKYIMSSEFAAHAATHKSYQNNSSEADCDLTEEVEEVGNSDGKGVNPSDVAAQNKVVTESNDNDGTVEPWNSDSDPCSFNGSPFDVQVQVHVQKEVDDNIQNEESTHRSKSVFDDVNVQVEINDCFSEEMAKNLKMDLENLFNETGSNINKSGNENLKNQAKGNETNASKEINNNEGKLPGENDSFAISQDIFASDPNENQRDNINPELSMDIFSNTITTETNNTVNNDTTINNVNKNVTIIDTINLDDDEDEDIESNSKPSSRDILSRMLTDDSDVSVLGVINRNNERQSFIEETKRIRELMFSRD